MNKLLKLLKSLEAQGFATAAQKAEVAALYKELDEEGKEVVKEDVDNAGKLPETDPNAGADTEDKELEKNLNVLISKAVTLKTEESVGEAVKGIKKEVKEYLEEQVKALKAMAGNQHPDVKEKRVGMNAYLRNFMRAVLANDTQELLKLNHAASVKELTSDSTGTPFGGYAVDRELSAEIRLLTTEYGVARREFFTVQLSKNSYTTNELATDVTVFWVDEANQIGSTQIVLGRDNLSLKKLGAIVTLTRELLEDSEIDLFGFIGTRVAEGFARFEDRAFFMGEGAGDTTNAEYTGVVFGAGNEVVIPVRGSNDGESFSHMTADDLLAMQDASPQSVAADGKYYMHRSIRNLVRAFKDDNGAPIYQSPSENGPATIWGRPVVEVEVMPSTADSAADTAFVLYGKLREAAMLGYKGSISADRFNAGIVRNVANNADINLITTDREAVRWVERVGATLLIPTAATVLKTGGGS